MLRLFFCFFLFALLIFGCKENNQTLFHHVPSSHSGITFSNTITENDTISINNFQYCYNGGGVGIGDFNNDELPDIVFTGNQVSSKIYLNKGNLQFKDISSSSGFITSSWVTGVSVVDINADGWDDIYLSVGGPDCKGNCNNLLFINQGLSDDDTISFTEQAKEYGLDDGLYSQQSVFFDYDLDGDLDVYIVHNGNGSFDKNSPLPKKYYPKNLNDHLLRNDYSGEKKHSFFTNVSDSLGISLAGYGLGVAITDFNFDGLPDIYVSNDFITEDLLYINKARKNSANPSFEEVSKKILGHETYNAMGVDIADINNDQLPDVLVLDMLPENYFRQKTMLSGKNYDRYKMALNNSYSSQFVHNTLQLNNGFLNDSLLKMSEVGFQKGIADTDWSWAPLMLDFDNDGDKDIYISNGYVKNVTDLNYVNYSGQNTMFGTKEERRKKMKEFTDALEPIHIPNFIYENVNSSEFRNVSDRWIEPKPSFSNGVAYADFDKDGDLDLAINNINAEAFLLENKVESITGQPNYLRVKLKGTVKNPNAIGAKVFLWQGNDVQYNYQTTVRGYLSSIEPIVHFGLKNKPIDSIRIVWPNGKEHLLKNISANQILEVNQKNAVQPKLEKKDNTTYLFSNTNLLKYKDGQKPTNDYIYQNLLLHEYSNLGPCMTTANVDGKEGDEIYIGGSKEVAGKLFGWDSISGNYKVIQEFDIGYQDGDAVFIDIDNDQDLDLLVVSGGFESEEGSENYKNRVYLNNGQGEFSITSKILLESETSNHCIRLCDIDQDGDMDAFIGARVSPRSFPNIPMSSILWNTNQQDSVAKIHDFEKIGMVTDAIWEDIDKDGWEDLIVVGEWMPIKIFKNIKGQLTLSDSKFLSKDSQQISTSGFWNCIEKGDFDKDGDMDFIVGNKGQNGFLEASQKYPLYVYTGDFDNNGSQDPVIGKYFDTDQGKKLMPLQSRDDVMKQLNTLRFKYQDYNMFAQVTFLDLLQIKNIDLETLKISMLESCLIENLGNNTYKIHSLPSECQVSSINDILVDDLDKDGWSDCLLVGNDLSSEINYGISDGLTGIVLKGSNDGFKVVPSKESGFYVPEQANYITKVTLPHKKDIIVVTRNRDSILNFRVNNQN